MSVFSAILRISSSLASSCCRSLPRHHTAVVNPTKEYHHGGGWGLVMRFWTPASGDGLPLGGLRWAPTTLAASGVLGKDTSRNRYAGLALTPRLAAMRLQVRFGVQR